MDLGLLFAKAASFLDYTGISPVTPLALVLGTLSMWGFYVVSGWGSHDRRDQ